jgi:hypothetical protein
VLGSVALVWYSSNTGNHISMSIHHINIFFIFINIFERLSRYSIDSQTELTR